MTMLKTTALILASFFLFSAGAQAMTSVNTAHGRTFTDYPDKKRIQDASDSCSFNSSACIRLGN